MTSMQRDWRQFALLLIDVQRDFWTEQAARDYPHFPENTARLLALCRAEQIDVIHLRVSFKEDMSDWMPKYRLQGGIPCIEGTAGVETLPFALDEPGEEVITKHALDGFRQPELLQYLQREQKRFVLTAGLVTSVCVLLTTASAVQNGFLAAVVEDCCADNHPEAHRQMLNRYGFAFDTTALDLIPHHYPEWLAALKELDELGRVES